MSQAQIQIWVKPGEPLREKDWVAAGFLTLADYIESLRQESERGYRSNGKPKDTGKNLPLVSFGIFDGDKKTVAAICQTAKDLPNTSLPGLVTFDNPPADAAV